LLYVKVNFIQFLIGVMLSMDLWILVYICLILILMAKEAILILHFIA